VVGTDVLSLRVFLKILSGNGPKYNFDDINYNDPPRMCYHIDGEVQPEEALGLTPPDQSSHSRAAYLQEKADCLHAQ
jgi:hypothetical protein